MAVQPVGAPQPKEPERPEEVQAAQKRSPELVDKTRAFFEAVAKHVQEGGESAKTWAQVQDLEKDLRTLLSDDPAHPANRALSQIMGSLSENPSSNIRGPLETLADAVGGSTLVPLIEKIGPSRAQLEKELAAVEKKLAEVEKEIAALRKGLNPNDRALMSRYDDLNGEWTHDNDLNAVVKLAGSGCEKWTKEQWDTWAKGHRQEIDDHTIFGHQPFPAGQLVAQFATGVSFTQRMQQLTAEMDKLKSDMSPDCRKLLRLDQEDMNLIARRDYIRHELGQI